VSFRQPIRFSQIHEQVTVSQSARFIHVPRHIKGSDTLLHSFRDCKFTSQSKRWYRECIWTERIIILVLKQKLQFSKWI